MSEGANGKPVLVLDFDGVLSDSLLEAYLLTWNIAGRVDPSLAHQSDTAPSIETIREFRSSHRGHWDAFERIVPFGNRAEDYLVMQRAVDEGRTIATQEEFSAFKQQVDRQYQDKFHEEFYVLRYHLAEHRRELWLALNAPFPGVRRALDQLAAGFRLCVATSKDRETVTALLETWGLSVLIDSDRVVDKRAGESKQAHLGALRELFGCSYAEMTFIDDKVSHLLDCRGLGVRLLLAGWGYNGTQQHEQAAAAGIGILELSSLGSLSA